MGVHSGLITLISRPDIKSIEAIRGKRVAVDALKTGYALVLYRLLRDRGLEANRDYSIIGVGGTPARMKALEDDKAVAAMLSPPFDLTAEKAGYNVLAGSREIGPYQGSVYAARRSWAKDHDAQMLAYIRAIVAATDYIFANKAGAIAILKKHEPRLSDEALERLYTTLTGPGGFDPHAALNMAGVKAVLALRQADSPSGKKLDPPGTYIDESYYERALSSK
jgi:ABC-type nitrate/sulfonate/bicarbonate transport system substrate-binding protein